MHITTVCPFCQTSYQVQPTLRGQPIRCPNGVCRKVFTISPDSPGEDFEEPVRTPKTGPPPGNGQRSGSVGDMVPILPSESASAPETTPSGGGWWQGPPAGRPVPDRPTIALPPSPPPPPAPVEAAWWRDAPPPARDTQVKSEPIKPPKEPPHEAARAQPTVLQTPESPRELPPGMWEPPPVRRGPATEEPKPQPGEETTPAEETPLADAHQPLMGKRRARRLIAVLIAGLLVILGGGGVLTWLTVHKSEAERFAEANSELRHEHYGNAASLFGDLAVKFPDSEKASEYQFLHEWAKVCGPVADPGDNLADAVEELHRFVKEHNKDLKDHLTEQNSRNAGQLLVRLSRAFAEHNAAPPDDKPLETAKSIEQLLGTVEGLSPNALTKADRTQVESDLSKVRAAVARASERRDVLAKLHALPNEKPFDAIQRVRSLLERKKRDLPGLDKDDEVQAALNQLYDAHLASVVYQTHAEDGSGRSASRLDENAESLPFAPLLTSADPGRAPDNDPIVLALARGVLYALKQSNGDLKWAMRVGIDTTALPLRVPRRQGSPELFLVLSADTQTLTALDADSNQLWEYAVGQPVLGRPVIIDQRAYLAAYDGWVHEIELAGGQPLGRYPLGQRLTCGGAREGTSKRIYFPADDSCIYVLDVGEKRCVTILYDGHPSGSLRSEPIIIPPKRRDPIPGEQPGGLAENPETPGYLILNQASGLDAMHLRVFELPLRDRHAAPLTLNPPARLDGWTWFEPFQDGEKVATLSDAGILGLFGIRQVGNKDQALFPLLESGSLDLSKKFLGAGPDAMRERGRAQVVHMQDNDLWVLAHGRLQRVELLWSNKAGPQAVAGWPKSLALGSPLHAPQRIEDRDGRSTFFLVTQPLGQQTCVASAVSDEGHILWQRQLGLVFQGEPLALTPPDGGSPMLLALDQGGSLFVLDPSRPANSPRVWKSLAPALDDNPRLPPLLLPSADGRRAYEIAARGDGASLIVRQIDWGKGERGLRVRQGEIPLPTTPDSKTPRRLAGTPVMVGSQLIVPMAAGYLARLRLPLEDKQPHLEPGPNWRSEQAAPNVPCYVLGLGGDRFLRSDGSRGLRIWEWPKNGEYHPLPAGSNPPDEAEPAAQLQIRVAAPMALLRGKDGQMPRVVVADSAGVLHLLTVSADGSLQQVRAWDLGGKITAAPFVYELPDGGVRVVCLLDQRRLVWLDPARPDPPQPCRTGGETIVGRPQMVEDMLVVALQSGHYIGLDPATGEAKGPGYTLRSSAAPAAAPVPFGPGRMLAPLSDGTALLLSVDLLRQPKP